MSVAESNIREPKQGRSRASFERMLDAATEILSEQGYEELTLMGVSKRAKVSIGSIYCRVDSKDDLIHAVQRRVLDRIYAEQQIMFEPKRWEGADLGTLVPKLVAELAEFMRRHAPVFRPFMTRAAADPVIEAVGKRYHSHMTEGIRTLIMARRHEIRHPDPDHAVAAGFGVVYASLARYLGLGTSPDVVGEGDWDRMKEDLGVMCLLFLQYSPAKAGG